MSNVSKRIAGDSGESLDLGSIPALHHPSGNVAAGIPRHERTFSEAIPFAPIASIGADNATPPALNEAMRRCAAQQAADEDDEMAIIAIMMAGAQCPA